MDTTPDSQFDKLAQKVNALELGITTVVKRVASVEDTMLRLLDTIKRREDSAELRISQTLHRVLSNVVHELGHSIDVTKEQLAQLERGFDIFPVDGHTVQENSKTVLVRRTSPTTYDFAMANDPGKVMNEGTERFTAWFNENPDVMGERDEMLVNVVAYTKAVQPSEQEAV